MAVDDATEHWLPVVGFEGLYEVSDFGRVRSLDRTVVTSNGPRQYRGRLLKSYINKGTRGYPFVGLSRPGLNASYPVHILVLTAHAGPCPAGQEARHGPAGKADASLENLCWGTRAQNVGPDRVRDGQSNRGERQGRHKLTETQVLEIRRRRAAGEELRPLAEEFGVSVQTISGIGLGNGWAWLDGERSPRRIGGRKLTDDQVREIRRLRAQGVSLKFIAQAYEVSVALVSAVALRKMRADVE